MRQKVKRNVKTVFPPEKFELLKEKKIFQRRNCSVMHRQHVKQTKCMMMRLKRNVSILSARTWSGEADHLSLTFKERVLILYPLFFQVNWLLVLISEVLNLKTIINSIEPRISVSNHDAIISMINCHSKKRIREFSVTSTTVYQKYVKADVIQNLRKIVSTYFS